MVAVMQKMFQPNMVSLGKGMLIEFAAFVVVRWVKIYHCIGVDDRNDSRKVQGGAAATDELESGEEAVQPIDLLADVIRRPTTVNFILGFLFPSAQGSARLCA